MADVSSAASAAHILIFVEAIIAGQSPSASVQNVAFRFSAPGCPGPYFGALGSIGVVPRTPRMSSSALAPARSCASPRGGATTCNPTGRPDAVKPQGSESAGQHTSV